MIDKIKIPPKSYFDKAKDILYGSAIDIGRKNYSFNRIRKACYNSEALQKLISSLGSPTMYEISAGTSDRKAYRGYINQIVSDIKNNRYYREYTTASGNLLARKALAFSESLKLTSNQNYTADDVCFAEGTTGAITMVFEYIKKYFPYGKILIQTPNYYIYKLAALYFGLDIKEIIPSSKNGLIKSFLSIDSIIKEVTPQTKLIIITNPANPSGEIYLADEIEKLLMVAKRKNILVLTDELFSELVFEKEDYTYADEIASKIGAMDNLVISKGYSKNKNLAGFRIGYLLSKKSELIDACAKIAEQRHCFPVASNFTGLICLDSFIQSVDFLMEKGQTTSIKTAAETAVNELHFAEAIKEKSNNQLIKCYLCYRKYLSDTMRFYSARFDDALELLKNEIVISMPKKSAFNTFVKIKNLEKVNQFDFLLNLYLTTGVKIEIGPGFGLIQKRWETEPELGFWLRITFARDRNTLTTGLKKFIQFKQTYLAQKNKFLTTNLYF
jgi:aspartate/methionine/tyrosine aminotransferase